MLFAMLPMPSSVARRALAVVAPLLLATSLLAACQKPAPVAAAKPKRHSFQDSSSYQPVTSAPATGGSTADTNAQAAQVKQTWEQAHQAGNEAEAQQRASEALKQTQQMADSPAPH
jgi:hypothetical protein